VPDSARRRLRTSTQFNSPSAEFPLIDNRPPDIATRLDTQARQLAALPISPAGLRRGHEPCPTRASLDAPETTPDQLRRLMIATPGRTRLALLPPLRPAAEARHPFFEPPRPARVSTRRARLRDRAGPPHGRRHGADHLVRAPRLDADHRDPRHWPRGLPPASCSAAST
jgi:hypothetical protein